jgi:uncharacterized RDD family membrane protein YckC
VSDQGQQPPRPPQGPNPSYTPPQQPGYAPPPQQGGYAPSPVQYGPSGPRAGFWARFGAYLLDYLLLAIVPGIVIAIGLANSNLTHATYGSHITYTSNSVSPLVWIGYILLVLLPIVYFVYFEGGPTGQTLGKKAVGIRIVDYRTGGPIGYGRAFIRYLGRIVSGAVCLLGYLWMLWDREKQTWHDKFAADVVVPVDAYPLR